MRKSSLLLLTSAAGCWPGAGQKQGAHCWLGGELEEHLKGYPQEGSKPWGHVGRTPGHTSSQFRRGDLCNAEMLRLVRTARAWKSYFRTPE